MFIPWLALQGLAFWLPWFWRIQDRSWSCGPFLSQHSDHNDAHYLHISTNSNPWGSLLVELLDAPMGLPLSCNTIGFLMQTEQQELGVRSQVCPSARWRGYFDNNSLLTIYIFCHISQMDIGWAWMIFVFFWMFLNFSVLSSKITFDFDIFLSFGTFCCHCIAILSCMIIAV